MFFRPYLVFEGTPITGGFRQTPCGPDTERSTLSNGSSLHRLYSRLQLKVYRMSYGPALDLEFPSIDRLDVRIDLFRETTDW